MNGEWFEIFWISIKAIHQEALCFYLYHNISKHISISVLFFIISVWFLAGFLKISALGGRVLAQFFALSLCPGGGKFALSKNFPGDLPGGWVWLGINWYIKRLYRCLSFCMRCCSRYRPLWFGHWSLREGRTDDIFARGCATLWSLHLPFLEFLTKK